MVTGGVRTVLLVVTLAAVSTSRSPPGRVDNRICNKTPYDVFHSFYDCNMEHIRQLSSYEAAFGKNATPTIENLLAATHDACTEGMIAGIACFKDLIKDCNATNRAKLNSLLETGVGFLCLPEGAGVEPAMSYVLNYTSDEELAQSKNSPCDVRDYSCYNAFHTDWEMVSLEALAPMIQSAMEDFSLCVAAKYEAARRQCPHWRADLLHRVIEPMFLSPILGLRLPFTEEELADMFRVLPPRLTARTGPHT